MNEATARIRINALLAKAGWRFFTDAEGPPNVRLEQSVTLKPADLDALGNDFERTERGMANFLLLDDRGFPCPQVPRFLLPVPRLRGEASKASSRCLVEPESWRHMPAKKAVSKLRNAALMIRSIRSLLGDSTKCSRYQSSTADLKWRGSWSCGTTSWLSQRWAGSMSSLAACRKSRKARSCSRSRLPLRPFNG